MKHSILVLGLVFMSFSRFSPNQLSDRQSMTGRKFRLKKQPREKEKIFLRAQHGVLKCLR